jgi:hypothetical protein
MPNSGRIRRMATTAIARRASAQRPTASGHRLIRRKSQTLHLHPRHTASVQAVSPRAAAEMTLKQQALAEIKAAWQKTEKYNLEFGKVCYEWRNKFKAQGFRKEGDGVCAILDKLRIPRSTAYFWMNKYEISIGLKPARPTKETTEVPSVWTRADEKRANRSDPIAGMEGYKLLAKKMLETGYRALVAKKAADQSHLWAAKDWAQLRLDLGDALED